MDEEVDESGIVTTSGCSGAVYCVRVYFGSFKN